MNADEFFDAHYEMNRTRFGGTPTKPKITAPGRVAGDAIAVVKTLQKRMMMLVAFTAIVACIQLVVVLKVGHGIERVLYTSGSQLSIAVLVRQWLVDIHRLAAFELLARLAKRDPKAEQRLLRELMWVVKRKPLGILPGVAGARAQSVESGAAEGHQGEEEMDTTAK